MAQTQYRPVTEEQLKIALEPITREVNDMRADLRGMQKIITGNGTGIGLDEQARNNRRDIDKNSAEINELKKFSKELQPVILFYRVGVWMASVLGVSILALIWGLLTGQVEILTP